MNKKNIIILVTAAVILVGIIVVVMMNSKQEDTAPWGTAPIVQKKSETEKKAVSPENNVPKDNVTTDKMTKEQADFANDFKKKTSPTK